MRVISILLVVCVVLLCTNVHAATISAASCSYADVSSAISSASPNDTVNVPAGSCTWGSTLSITKGINLIGAGIGNTVISGNNRGSGNFLIVFAPTSGSQAGRISGFTFNVTQQQAIQCSAEAEPTTNTIRIDHNRFANSTTNRAIMNWGCFGVIDNNTFEVKYPFGLGNSRTSLGKNAWDSYSDNFLGTANYLYAEDNTITLPDDGVGYGMVDCDQGGRWAIRYNNITATEGKYPFADTHEWGTSGYGCMGAELYGNKFITSQGGFLLSSQGAGRHIVHHNLAPGMGINLYSDGDGGCSPAYSARQIINNSYFFQSRASTTGTLVSASVSQNSCGFVVENSAYWKDNSSCLTSNTCTNITTGVGCGTLASRPTNCTTGSAYWATDQSCTSLAGMVGANPSTPVSGTLYKCTATNTWTSWYTPYTYPHPLRGAVEKAPSPPSLKML